MVSDRPHRGRVLVGGLVGGSIGLLLLALSIFLTAYASRGGTEVVGGFLCLAVALLSLGLGAQALWPLALGGLVPARPALAATWVGLALLGGGLTLWISSRASMPWLLFALAPLLVVAGLIKDIGRVRNLA